MGTDYMTLDSEAEHFVNFWFIARKVFMAPWALTVHINMDYPNILRITAHRCNRDTPGYLPA